MAEDGTEEALLAVFRGLPSLRAPEAIITWVRAVSVRAAVRLARQADREAAPAQASVEPHASSLEGLGDIGDAVGRLPLAQRALLVLRTCEGLTEREIATTTRSAAR